jgi:anhydro-N-acetylmuramic acid kinase
LGTSLDGVDAALLQTDGEKITGFGEHLTLPYTDEFRARLREATRQQTGIATLARDLAEIHAEAVLALLAQSGKKAEEIAVVGFHGQTVLHAPKEGISWQIGDAALLAARVGIPVVADFRSADVAAGGQGAPLVPIYHAALANYAGVPQPCAFLNLGGISNLTYIAPDALLACDSGPANGLLNEWMHIQRELPMDEGGKAALSGTVHNEALDAWLSHPFFAVDGPKSLDRHSFDLSPITHLNVEDGAATLVALAAVAVDIAQEKLPARPKLWIACGGGVHNPAMMQALRTRLGDVKSADELGLSADAMEAQAFAYLAMRHLRGLPTSLPSTTGARHAVVGGAFYPHVRGVAQ